MAGHEATYPLGDGLTRSDPAAAEAVFARYAQRLASLADQHLSHKLAARLDGEDVVQSVFRTFFRRSAAGEFQIDCSAQLWRLLVTITMRKVRAKARYHTAGVRTAMAEANAGTTGRPEAVAAEPGPDAAAALVDEIEVLLRGLPTLHCQVLEGRLRGESVSEIADRLGITRQSVYRVLNVLQMRLIEREK
jgi:RNA polymerase sigma-70 factor (ECF subfamily)